MRTKTSTKGPVGKNRKWARLLFMVLSPLYGMRLAFVGYELIIEKHWPDHMGFTLNFYLLVFKILGPPTDAYFGGVFLIIVGLLFTLPPLYFLCVRNRK